MSFLTDVFVSIISGYIAFTTGLANVVETNLLSQPTEEAQEMVDEAAESDDRLSFLPSSLRTIPDILLQNSEYQKAALASVPGLTGTTAPEPVDALVNILCTFTTDEYIRTTTGTGFFIDPDGVIMTNAHVAQFLLMESALSFGDAECILRSGNPATPTYRADLLYISPAWIQENAGIYNDEVPMGTGERDYALLYVTERLDNEPLPALFPALSFDASLLPVSLRGTTVTAAGYPATDLLTEGPGADLIPRQAETSVSELYTFGSNYADVISIKGSVVGAEGASGGPVLDATGNVIGMIVTRGDDSVDGPGSLRAITLSHIDRTIRQETGFPLSDNLSGDLGYRSEIFGNTLSPFLITILEQAE